MAIKIKTLPAFFRIQVYFFYFTFAIQEAKIFLFSISFFSSLLSFLLQICIFNLQKYSFKTTKVLKSKEKVIEVKRNKKEQKKKI